MIPNGRFTVKVLTRRESTLRLLLAVWEKRDIPPMLDNELRRLSDAHVAFLLRFWTWKDQHWDESEPREYKEEPPQGWAFMFRQRPLTPVTVETLTANTCHQINRCSGRCLVPRQASKRR